MSLPLFRPFDHFDFSDSTCFLTGQKAVDHITVFPEWMIGQFGLSGKPFKMLDERVVSYSDIKVPVSAEALSALGQLESEISEAFALGYEAVNVMDPVKLFQWTAKQVYGIIHNEVRAGLRQQAAIGEPFNFSQGLMHKFGNLHLMLQSLIRPVEFEGVQPWTIRVFPVRNPDDTFIYRDEINTLVFSLRMADFGLIACLQDNGESAHYHRSILEKVKGKALQPEQFEEICARFFYSAYLFNRLPEYSVLSTDEAVYIEAMPLRIASKPVFDTWQVKTYGQVLENFWKPWGYTLFEIIKDPEKPMSFIED